MNHLRLQWREAANPPRRVLPNGWEITFSRFGIFNEHKLTVSGPEVELAMTPRVGPPRPWEHDFYRQRPMSGYEQVGPGTAEDAYRTRLRFELGSVIFIPKRRYALLTDIALRVKEEYRRLGVATVLFDELFRRYPKTVLDAGAQSGAGRKFWDSYKAAHPELADRMIDGKLLGYENWDWG